MSTRTMTITYQYITYKARIGSIEKTLLGAGPHDFFTATLHVCSEHWEATLGGSNFSKDNSGEYALSQIKKILDVAGVETWEELTDAYIAVLFTNDEDERPVGFAHPMFEDKVFLFMEHRQNFDLPWTTLPR